MALADVTTISPGGQNRPPAQPFRTEAGSTDINAGEPVKVGGTGNSYVVPSADAEPLTTAPTFAGIAASNSTHTASTDGTVDVQLPVSGVVYSCLATDPSAVDTDAELLALLNDTVLFNLASGTYTVDTAGIAADNGLKIVGGDITTGAIHFVVRDGATILA